MNKLISLYTKARRGLQPYEQTPESCLRSMARICGRDEVAAIHIRLKMFKAELAMTPDWDGDTQDQIYFAIEEHTKLLILAEKKDGLT